MLSFCLHQQTSPEHDKFAEFLDACPAPLVVVTVDTGTPDRLASSFIDYCGAGAKAFCTVERAASCPSCHHTNSCCQCSNANYTARAGPGNRTCAAFGGEAHAAACCHAKTGTLPCGVSSCLPFCLPSSLPSFHRPMYHDVESSTCCLSSLMQWTRGQYWQTLALDTIMAHAYQTDKQTGLV